VEVPLWNWQRAALGSVTLPGDVFNVPVRRDILQRVVRWQLAKRQQARVLTCPYRAQQLEVPCAVSSRTGVVHC